MNKWIPCETRLPELKYKYDGCSFKTSDPVLVTGEPEYYNGQTVNIFIAVHEDDLNGTTYWSMDSDGEHLKKVTAWMPLPEPYKKTDDIDLESIDYCPVKEQEGDWICSTCQRKDGCKWRW